MAQTVNVPGLGKTNTTWVVAGGAAIVGIVVYAYLRRARSQASALTEGDAVPGDQWSPDAFSGATAPGGETFDPQDVNLAGQPPRTNAEWTQRVVDWLVNVGQYDMQFTANTIGKYLAGNPLNAGEKLLVQAGIGALGSPPAGALPIISGPEPTVPQPVGGKLATPAGLRLQTNRPGYFVIGWNAVSNASYYMVKGGPIGHPIVGPVFGLQKVGRGVPSGSHRAYWVQAHGPGRSPSGWAGPIKFTTA
jgi:hypothetical protein